MGAKTQHTVAPQDFLDEADREFAVGNWQAGSKSMWEATKAAILAAADARGLDCPDDMDGYRQVVRVLGREFDNQLTQLSRFAVAESYHDNAEEVYWMDVEFEMCQLPVKRLVHYLMAKAAAAELKRGVRVRVNT